MSVALSEIAPVGARESVVNIVSENIRALAARFRVTQKQLSREIGMNQTSMSERWTGKRQWQLEDLDKVAAVFGVEPWELVQPPANMGNARRMASVSRSYTARDSNPEPIDSWLVGLADVESLDWWLDFRALAACYA